jgi:hypothetical protein
MNVVDFKKQEKYPWDLRDFKNFKPIENTSFNGIKASKKPKF